MRRFINKIFKNFLYFAGGLKKGIIHDVVVHANPKRPPYTLRPIVAALISAGLAVSTVVCTHNTVQVTSTSC